MQVLVTGGAGFIGSHLVDQIVAEGHSVTVLDDYSSGDRAKLAEAEQRGRVRVIEGSILDESALDDAMVGVDAVFHLAVECVRKSLGEPLSNHAINATGTLQTLEAARRHEVRRFVYCSSSEVYGNSAEGKLSEDATVCAPTTVYGAAKLAGELYALAYWRTYRLPTTVIRPFNTFGPREHDRGALAEVIPRFVIRVLNGLSPVIFGDGTQGRDFTYVTDTARGLWRAGISDETVGSIINLGWGRLITIREVAATIIRQCGRNDVSLEFAAERPGDIRSLIADTEKARKMIEFAPTVDFSEGIERYLKWFRAQYPDVAALVEPDIKNWKLPSGGAGRALPSASRLG
jgi:UDP-glucose 4-epimerase